MSFKQDYPDLANFLGAWFPDADLENQSDEEVVKRFASVVAMKELNLVLEQGRRLLAETSFPWNEVSEEANRYFSGSEDASQWLAAIVEILESARLTKLETDDLT